MNRNEECEIISLDRCESSDGEAVPFSFISKTSIDVVARNADALLLFQIADAANLRGDFFGEIGEVSADLYNTSTFGFNNLGDTNLCQCFGVSFPGASGSIGSSTPVPAAWDAMVVCHWVGV